MNKKVMDQWKKEMFQAQEQSDILMRNISTKIFPHSECNI